MQLSFIIQARMGSSRLPNKILKLFYRDRSILYLLVEKLRQIPNAQIIVATSVNSENDIIEEFCNKNDVKCFRGSENDVLQRFIEAAEKYDAEKIVRVCSDNPFLDLNSIKLLVEKASASDADYISFMVNDTPSIKTHFGFWTEYTTLSTLKKVKQLTDESLYHEHVTNYIYSNPETFKIQWIGGPECLKNRYDIRLTCDTLGDFNSCKKIYEDLCENNPYPTIEMLVEYLDNHNEYSANMTEQIILNSK